MKQYSRKYTLLERIYVVEIFKGMMITMRHFIMSWFFNKKPTIQYPEKKRKISPYFRGRHILARDEEGRERCTGCKLCEYVCPANAINIVTAEVPENKTKNFPTEKYAEFYSINLLQCIFCGMCEQSCPMGAIYLTTEHEYSEYGQDKDKFLFTKDNLLVSKNDKKALLLRSMDGSLTEMKDVKHLTIK